MIIQNIEASETFPDQGWLLGRRVLVRFGSVPPEWGGVVVRDDAVAPGLLIIRLDDGRHVLSTECQYQVVSDPEGKSP